MVADPALIHGRASQDCALLINYPTYSLNEEITSWEHLLVLTYAIDLVSWDVNQKLFLLGGHLSAVEYCFNWARCFTFVYASEYDFNCVKVC